MNTNHYTKRLKLGQTTKSVWLFNFNNKNVALTRAVVVLSFGKLQKVALKFGCIQAACFKKTECNNELKSSYSCLLHCAIHSWKSMPKCIQYSGGSSQCLQRSQIFVQSSMESWYLVITQIPVWKYVCISWVYQYLSHTDNNQLCHAVQWRNGSWGSHRISNPQACKIAESSKHIRFQGGDSPALKIKGSSTCACVTCWTPELPRDN